MLLLEKQTNIVSTIFTFLLLLASPQGDTTPLLFHLDSSSGFVSRFLVNPSYIHIRNLFQALVSFFSSLFVSFLCFLPSITRSYISVFLLLLDVLTSLSDCRQETVERIKERRISGGWYVCWMDFHNAILCCGFLCPPLISVLFVLFVSFL